MEKRIELLLGDCLIESDRIETGKVDLILTDLPYGTIKNFGNENVQHGLGGKTEWDDEIDPFDVFTIASRILRMNGKMVLFSQEPYSSCLITQCHSNVKFLYKMVWKKDHFANSLIAKKSPVSYIEDVLVFSKQYDTDNSHPLRLYFQGILNFIGRTKKSIIEVVGQQADHCFRFDSSQFGICTSKTYADLINHFGLEQMDEFKTYEELEFINSMFNSMFNSTFNLWEGGKYKSNVLEYKKDYDGYHPTQKPIALLEDLIKTFSNENDLVVDLTMGSGSTGVAARKTNRRFVGIEKEKKYFDIATKRIESQPTTSKPNEYF